MLLVVSGLEPAAAVQVGPLDGGENSPNSRWEGQERSAKSAWREEQEFEGNAVVAAQALTKLYQAKKEERGFAGRLQVLF